MMLDVAVVDNVLDRVDQLSYPCQARPFAIQATSGWWQQGLVSQCLGQAETRRIHSEVGDGMVVGMGIDDIDDIGDGHVISYEIN